jgi:hypothetical protein
MEITENILKEFKDRNIDINKFLSFELDKFKRSEEKIEEIRGTHDINRIQHAKFIELFRRGCDVGVDIYSELFTDIINPKLDGSSFNKLMSRISNLSKKYAGIFRYYKNIKDIDDEDEYEGNDGVIPNVSSLKGYISEIFYECFSKLLEKDEDFPFYSYMPNNGENDNGVDGFAISKYDNKLATIQNKFKSLFFNGHKNKIFLIERDIKQFGWQSVKKYGIPLDTYGNMVIITNCEGLHYHTDDEVFLNAFKTLNGNFIKNKIENFAFWNGLSNMVFNTLDYELTNEEKINLSKINTIKK